MQETLTVEPKQISSFDDVLVLVGNHGPFQRRYNLIFNLLIMIFTSMPFLNIVIIMHTPDHWCKVPGRENTSYTIEEWKNLTIPQVYDSKGQFSFSRCTMYNNSYLLNYKSSALHHDQIVDCQYGWEYDSTWYKSTVSTEENWVCDKELYVANTFTACRIGDVVGTLIVGHLGDTIGRKPAFLLSAAFMVIGRVMSVFTYHHYYWFLLAAFIGTSTSASVFQSPLLIAMEISREEDRAHINVLQCIGWSVGCCILPLIMWYINDWIVFLLVTSLPTGIYFFFHCYGIESPRWLVNRKQYTKAATELRKIAKANGALIPSNLENLLEQIHEEEEQLYGIFSVFSHWRLAKNTVAAIYIWTVVSIIYYFITLNVENIGGNPFLNFACLSLVELPGALLGKYICDKWGRQLGHMSSFCTTSIGSVILIFTIQDPNLEWLTIVLSTFLKFTSAIAFYSVNLQCLEMYPTCLRQTGMALLFITSGIFGFVGPYVKYLGTTVDVRYPYILFAVTATIGILAGRMLPETLNRQLPETLAEAQAFGKKHMKLKIPSALEKEDIER